MADAFPGSVHVVDLGLGEAPDESVWDYAGAHGLVIVSKDDDFRQRALLLGPPPKVVIVALGNCTTDEVEQTLRAHQSTLLRFAEEDESAGLRVNRIASLTF